MKNDQSGNMRKVSTYCYQCRSGPDLLHVKVVDGVAIEVEPNFDAARVHTGEGKICVKAYGLVQKTYHPHRVLRPMKRSNPKKGRDEDPGFVPITWDEALDSVAAKLIEAREKGLTDASGYPVSPPRSVAGERHTPIWELFRPSSLPGAPLIAASGAVRG